MEVGFAQAVLPLVTKHEREQQLLDASNSELDTICAAFERGERTLAQCIREVLKLKLR